MRALLLTLGHNSSAALVENGKLQWAYETERLTGKKSDSQFPRAVLELRNVDTYRPDIVYATHWAPDGNLSSMSQKHWHPHEFDGLPIRTLTVDRTHHDTHIWAAMCYAGDGFPYQQGTCGIVVDGFGTMGEHFSVYDLTSGVPRLLRRFHGYDTSLGLWYQYATAFMGMKMHEDEYKLLGYEVHVSPELATELDNDARDVATEWVERMHKSVYGSRYDPMYSISALSDVKQRIFDHLAEFCRRHELTDSTSDRSRCVIAFYVQSVLEQVVHMVLDKYAEPRRFGNFVCSGGVFYNVKLNRTLVNRATGKVCIYPLAGDQGNAIGLYYMDHPQFKFPDNLNLGARRLTSVGQVENLYVVDEVTALEMVLSQLRTVGYVNLVRGAMEFGPRAMCNTSTLAIPTITNVERINRANDRNTVMPMAPVMTRHMYYEMFHDAEKLWRSECHMITALEYKSDSLHDMLGIAHAYKWPYPHMTGRPQVVENDPFMSRVLMSVGHPLINTSFNFHGKPIAFDMPSIIDNHLMQVRRDPSFKTVVVKND